MVRARPVRRFHLLRRRRKCQREFPSTDGTVWTTDKDGPILCLLAAEITAVTGKEPGEHYRELTEQFGTAFYTRIDAPATPEQKAKLTSLSAANVTANELAGDAITAKLTHAPGNGAAIGGLKVVTVNGWFAARPSGTENVYKVYAESFPIPIAPRRDCSRSPADCNRGHQVVFLSSTPKREGSRRYRERVCIFDAGVPRVDGKLYGPNA